MSALTATTPPPPPPPPSPQSVYARYEAPAETAPAASDSSERFTEDSLPDLGGQAGAANSDEALEKLDSLSGEVREMRTMLQSQLASLAWANMEEHHPRQAELYDVLDPDRGDLDAYVALAEELGARRVVDVGCGTGRTGADLPTRGRRASGPR